MRSEEDPQHELRTGATLYYLQEEGRSSGTSMNSSLMGEDGTLSHPCRGVVILDDQFKAMGDSCSDCTNRKVAGSGYLGGEGRRRRRA
jgi:hypothetical protein